MSTLLGNIGLGGTLLFLCHTGRIHSDFHSRDLHGTSQILPPCSYPSRTRTLHSTVRSASFCSDPCHRKARDTSLYGTLLPPCHKYRWYMDFSSIVSHARTSFRIRHTTVEGTRGNTFQERQKTFHPYHIAKEDNQQSGTASLHSCRYILNIVPTSIPLHPSR